MEKTVKHRFLNNALFTALIVPLAFFVLRDTIAVLTGMMFEAMGGKESFLYQINDDISRLITAGLLMLILPIFFRGKCNFGFKGGLPKLGILLPYAVGEKYELESSDPESLALNDSRENGSTYVFEFSHVGAGTEDVKLTFSKILGDMPFAIKDYTVTVGFNADGTISSVGG